MTRENAKKLLPIIQAYVDGKEIECKGLYDDWHSSEDFNFDCEPENYRIKTEPKYRQFIDCDELIQFWESHYGNSNRPKGTLPLIWVKNGDYLSLITSFDIYSDEVLIDGTRYDLKDLFKAFIFLDGKPCGIEVTE